MSFGRDYLIPKPFDSRVLIDVSSAVAAAAIETGVARIQVEPETYRLQLETRLGRRREVMLDFILRARRDPRRIVYADGENERVLRAAAAVVEEGIARPVLLGNAARIEERAAALGLTFAGIEVVDPHANPERRERYARRFHQHRQRKGVTLEEARGRMLRPIYHACLMLVEGDAEGLIAGQESYYPDTIRPALEVIGTARDVSVVAGLYMMVLPNDVLFFADTTVNIDPDPEALAEIALVSARFAERLGVEPHVAMLSYSNFGSARHPMTDKVRRAVERLRARAPDLVVDGEMQADTAVVPELLRERYPFSRLRTAANVLIFPNLDAANIAYKLLARLGNGVEAIGPILLGMARPVHVLQRDSEAAEIVNLTAIAVVDAQNRAKSARGE